MANPGSSLNPSLVVVEVLSSVSDATVVYLDTSPPRKQRNTLHASSVFHY